jgi:hypothetical protein
MQYCGHYLPNYKAWPSKLNNKATPCRGKWRQGCSAGTHFTRIASSSGSVTASKVRVSEWVSEWVCVCVCVLLLSRVCVSVCGSCTHTRKHARTHTHTHLKTQLACCSSVPYPCERIPPPHTHSHPAVLPGCCPSCNMQIIVPVPRLRK